MKIAGDGQRIEGMRLPRMAGISAAVAILMGLIWLLAAPPPAAKGAPFTCSSSTVFVAQNSPTQLFRHQYGAGSTTFVAVGPVQAMTYNALAFNETDGYLYAMDNSSQGNLLRIHEDGSVESLGTPAGVPATDFLKGAMDPAGNYYIANPNSTAARVVNVSTMTSTALTLSGETNVSDWTYIDGYLWGAVGTTLRRVNATDGQVSTFTLPALMAGTYGAAWTYGNGDLGLSNNTSGTVYRIRIGNASSPNPTFEIVSTASGPSSGNNDGAACPGLPTDLSVTKTGPGTVEPGSQISWTITVTNNGPGDSSGMSVSDTLPAGVTNASTSTPGCDVVGGQVQCVLGFLPSGDSTEIVITATAPPNPDTCVTNAVELIANGVDPNPGNDNATHQTCTRPPLADLEIDKVASSEQVQVGGEITYTLTVTNNGPDAARGVTVTDAVPSSLRARSVQTSAGSCEIVRRTVVCSLGDLASGATANVTVTARVLGVGRIRNAASVTADFPSDPNLKNNISRYNIRALPGKTRLVVRKKANRRVVSRGDVVRYRIVVRNRGNHTARNVRVCDRLGSGLVFANRGGAKLVRGQACWRVKSLTPGSKRVFRVAARVVGVTGGRLKNRATAEAANASPARAQAAVRKRPAPTRPGGVTG